jgi:protein-S-isoprenylcysteine O-methyltransferase Ste14
LSDLPTEDELRRTFNQEQVLIKRAERQQVQNVAYRGRIAVVALAVLLVVAIPMAVATMLAQINDPSSVSAPLLLISSGGVLGGGVGALWIRQTQRVGDRALRQPSTKRTSE